MAYDIKKEIDSFYLTEPDTDKFMNIFQYGIDLMRQDIAGMMDQYDYEKAEEQFLDLMIIESGFKINFVVTVQIKRKVVKTAADMLKKRGTDVGIIYAVKEILDIDITIDHGQKTGFSLGNNSLGIDTLLGFGGYFLHLIIQSPILTADELDAMTKLVDFIKWGPNTFEIVQS